MKPNPPRTAAQKQAALEERDRRRKQLEAAWVLVEPALARAGHAGRYRVSRRDGKVVLTFDDRTPADIRPQLKALGVSELFSLEVDEDNSEEVWALCDGLYEEFERAGLKVHGSRLTEDSTGPVVHVTDELDADQGREADAICGSFAAAHQCDAGWEHDPLGPFTFAEAHGPDRR